MKGITKERPHDWLNKAQQVTEKKKEELEWIKSDVEVILSALRAVPQMNKVLIQM